MKQTRWTVLEVKDALGNREEVSWHKTKERAIERATALHEETGRQVDIDLDIVCITRSGRENVESVANVWSIP